MATGAFVTYCRVSTARQGRSGLGLDAQRSAVAGYLNGGDWRIVGEFVEVESGRSADRPELAKALACARLHRAALLVANVSRLTRSSAFLHKLLEAGVDVRFADLPSIEGPTGRFMLTQMAAVAELEAEMIGERTRKALSAAKVRLEKMSDDDKAARIADGKAIKLGGIRPGVEMTAETRAKGTAANVARAMGRAADLAPTIAELRGAGITSLGALARALTERGIPTAKDALRDRGVPIEKGAATWSPMQVSRVLKQIDG